MSARLPASRAVAVVLAAVVAVSLTAGPRATVPALAQPDETTVPPTVDIVVPEAPVVTVAPEVPTIAPPVATPEPIPTPEPAPIPTPEPIPTAQPIPTAEPTPTVDEVPTVVTTTAAQPTTTAEQPTTTAEQPTTTAATTAETSAPETTSAAETPTTSSSASTTAELAPSTTASTTGTETTADTTTTAGETSGTTATSGTSAEVTTSEATSSPTDTAEAAQVAPLEEPERLEATEQDIQAVKALVPVDKQPEPAPQSEIENLLNQLNKVVNPVAAPAQDAGNQAIQLTTKVLQWQPDWVQYDQYYRPVIFNPFPNPLQIVYMVAGIPQLLVIPALASVVTQVVQLGAYSFTAMLLNAAGIPTNVAVGNFFGGGYLPGPGQPPPPPPPPVVRYDDVPVVVRYTDQTYRPFRVQQIVDVGQDPQVGERKVLLDGATPAWGQWVENANGERQFEVHKTQQFPGMEAPAEGPLPGNYQLLAAESSTSGLSTKDYVLIGAAVLVALLGIGAIVWIVLLGRRRRAAGAS